MEEKMQCVFVGFYLDVAKIESFAHVLFEDAQIHIETKKIGDVYYLYTPISQYEKALIEGMRTADKMNLSLKWVDIYHHYNPLSYMSILYGFLKEERKDMVFENFASADAVHPFDIQKYVALLQQFLGGNTVMIQYRPTLGAVELFVEGDFASYDSILEKCKDFHSHVNSSPFTHTVFTEMNGKLSEVEYEKAFTFQKERF